MVCIGADTSFDESLLGSAGVAQVAQIADWNVACVESPAYTFHISAVYVLGLSIECSTLLMMRTDCPVLVLLCYLPHQCMRRLLT